MQALILAAGRGSRLGQQTEALPKCLLEVGGRPLIEHQLEALADAGIGPVGMVVGYRADVLREVVDIRAEYIVSERWDETNSLYSLWLARDWVKGPVVVLNSDLLVHPGALERLVAAAGDAIAFDSSSGHGREHMKVEVVDGYLRTMSKTLPAHRVSGENVGILSFSEDTAQAVFEAAGELLAAGGEDLWVSAAVCRVAEERRIRTVDIAGLPWGEIDFSYDLYEAQKQVWPAIRHARENPKAVEGRRSAPTPGRWSGNGGGGGNGSGNGNGNGSGNGNGNGNGDLDRAAPNGVLTLESPWRVLDPFGLDPIAARTQDDRSPNPWWVLESDQRGEVRVTGPTAARIESRLLLPRGRSPRHPYVLEVELDSERVDWFKQEASGSRTWSHPRWEVGSRQRLEIGIPHGEHTLGIRLVASDTGLCLVRLARRTRGPSEPSTGEARICLAGTSPSR